MWRRRTCCSASVTVNEGLLIHTENKLKCIHTDCTGLLGLDLPLGKHELGNDYHLLILGSIRSQNMQHSHRDVPQEKTSYSASSTIMIL